MIIAFLLSLFLQIQPPRDFYWYPAVLADCYDGDTCTFADVDLGLNIHRHDVVLRLHGINAPELRGPEKAAGEASRDYLLSLIGDGRPLVVQTYRDREGKYGRLLGTIWYRCGELWCNANQVMVQMGMAEEY